MAVIVRCLDTYAILEILYQNPSYKNILEAVTVIPDTTVAEFWNVIARKYGVEEADRKLRLFAPLSQTVPGDVMVEAMRFKLANKKTNISFFDAVGYIFAIRNKMLFVTSDKEFIGRPGVEYIK